MTVVLRWKRYVHRLQYSGYHPFVNLQNPDVHTKLKFAESFKHIIDLEFLEHLRHLYYSAARPSAALLVSR